MLQNILALFIFAFAIFVEFAMQKSFVVLSDFVDGLAILIFARGLIIYLIFIMLT